MVLAFSFAFYPSSIGAPTSTAAAYSTLLWNFSLVNMRVASFKKKKKKNIYHLSTLNLY